MNISTATLLNLLTPKLNDELKTKIQNSSKDGKIDIISLSQDKTVQTLLDDIFDDILTQNKSKDTLIQTLKNSKNLFVLKDMKSDIKTIINLLDKEPKFQEQIKILKEFLVDIKDIDQKNIKSTLTNSGIFLESKLKEIVEQKESQKENILIKKNQSINKDQITNSKVKNNTIPKTIQNETTIKIKENLNILKQNFTAIEQKGITVQDIPLIKQTIVNLENIVKDNSNISNDIKKDIEIKTVISQLLQKVKQLPIKDISARLQTIDLQTNNHMNQKDNIDKKNNIPKTNISFEQTEIKTVLQNIDTTIKTLSTITTNIDLSQPKSTKPNITNDIKTILLQLDDQLDEPFSNTNIEKQDLKQTVQKILAQIEFYQGLSYLLPSTTTYLPFSWDQVEDGDISFNKSFTNEDEFSCQINLILKKYGDTRILLQLDKKKNLSLNIAVSSDTLKFKMQQKLQNLRSGINKIGLNLQTLNIFDLETKYNKYTKTQKENLTFGLEVKV